MPVLLKVDEVAQILASSPKTVYGWIRDGKMPAVKLPGGGLRVKVAEVAKILEVKPADLTKELYEERKNENGKHRS